MQIGNKVFDIRNHTYIMGILNVTPDSFSDGGLYTDVESALQRAAHMIEEGADLLDIGGESTRPNYQKISEQEEIERISTVIERVKSSFDIPISVDTYKPKVANAAIIAGADMINDIWGLKYDPKMPMIIKEGNVACCLMHNRPSIHPGDFLMDMKKELLESVEIARNAGIEDQKIILDPGIGFAKTTEQNLKILANLQLFQELGFPLLLGASKKSVIGSVKEPPLPISLRGEGTYVTTVFAAISGYAFVRVHDIAQNKRAIEMTEAILRRGEQ